MRQFLVAFSFALILSSSATYANQETQSKAMQLADTGVVAPDANGDSQTTMVDVNGNLKVKPEVDKEGKPVDPNATAAPSTDNGNQQTMPEQPQSDQ